MIGPYATLAGEVHDLMRQLADATDELERQRRDHGRALDGLIRGLLEVMDSLDRSSDRLRDEESRAAVAAIAAQTRNLVEARGLAFIEFKRGDVPPLADVEVVATGHDPSLADFSVLRTVHRGVRDGQRIIRRAGVEINKLG